MKQNVKADVAPAQSGQMPLCPKCNVPVVYYDGCLGYESLQCPICHWDVNDPPPVSAPAECGQHTPGPWIACYDTILVESNNELVAECKSRHYGKAEDAANAIYIVRAVNAHDQLVSALKRALNCIDPINNPRRLTPIEQATVEQARAALAQAQKSA